MSCDVCCERFNKTNHKRIDCSFCDLKSCRGCVQRYMLSKLEDAHCMQCRHAWSRRFVDEVTTIKFRNGPYREHLENVLFEKQKPHFPELQPEVARQKRMIALWKRMNDVRGELYVLCVAHHIPFPHTREQYEHTYPAVHDKWHEYLRLIAEYETMRSRRDRQVPTRFIRKCLGSACHGHLNEDWHCTLCDKKFCKDCGEVVPLDGGGGEHACDPELVQTMRLIKSDTKPCPNCSEMITRIDGCSQMFCTMCATAFSFDTGDVIRGRVDNPHYFEHQRKKMGGAMSREHGDIPCGGMPTLDEMQNFSEFIEAYVSVRIIERDALWRWNPDFPIRELHTLRMSFLMGYINEERFKADLRLHDKRRERSREIVDLCFTLSHTCADLFRRMVLGVCEGDPVAEFNAIVDLLNTEFASIRKRYKCSIPGDLQKIILVD